MMLNNINFVVVFATRIGYFLERGFKEKQDAIEFSEENEGIIIKIDSDNNVSVLEVGENNGS